MNGRVLVTVVVLGTTLSLGGCAMNKEGSGVEASEARDLDAFTRLSLSGEADAAVTVGGTQRVTVRGDDNLLADVKTEVDDDTLEVSDPSTVDLQPKVGLTVEITVPELEEVEVSGSSDVNVEDVTGDLFRVEVSGAADVEASGEVIRVDAEVSGAGDIRLADLLAEDVIAEVSGAGDIFVHATESLDASVSGAGDIIYTGDPQDVKTDVSGSGDVRPG